MKPSVPALALVIATSTLATPALATKVNVVGIAGSRAIVSIDGSEPRTMGVGQTIGAAKLLSVEGTTATFEIDGRRQVLGMGQFGSANPTGEDAKVVLRAAEGGHFFAEAVVNTGSVRFLVDTGATAIALSTQDALRLGIKYREAPMGRVQTANGSRPVWRVKLDTVRIGAITMNGVDAMIMEGGLGMPLLGMSFLSRTNMTQAGNTLTLTKRY